MKSFKISLVALVVAVACFAFTKSLPPKGIGPNCEAQLAYFQVDLSITPALTCPQINDVDQLILPTTPDDGDNVPESGEVLLTISDNDPHGCQDITTTACTVGYLPSQLEKVGNIWQPKQSEVASYQCCIRRSN